MHVIFHWYIKEKCVHKLNLFFVSVYVSKHVNVAGLRKNVLMQCGIVGVCIIILLQTLCNGSVTHYSSKIFGQ